MTASVLCVRKKEHIRPALFAGAIAGMIPDLDVLIRSSTDPLLNLQYHRHFTHALAFIPIGGFIAVLLCWPVMKRALPFRLLLLCCIAAYATHGLLDACTNYGTHLLWPFSNLRTSWNIISIIDPIFTLTILALLAVCSYRRSVKPALLAACFGLFYFSLGVVQRERAEMAMFAEAARRNHTIERFEVKPSFGNLLVWRGQYLADGIIHTDAYRAPPLGEVVPVGTGEQIALFAGYGNLPEGSVQAKDIDRFRFFSDGWLAQLPGNPTLIGDMRFATLPHQLQPLWAIQLFPAEPERHVAFVNLRGETGRAFTTLWKMIVHGN